MAQSIPSYCMSVFLLLTTLCDDIHKMMNSLWWGTKKNLGKGMNWLSWDKLTMGKNVGGMGFGDLEGFNLAVLGKQGWKLLTNTDAMVSRIIKAKYYLRGNFLEAKLGHNPSFSWRSIRNSQVLLKNGLHWRVGFGSHINIWSNHWLREINDPYIHIAHSPFINILHVNELICP